MKLSTSEMGQQAHEGTNDIFSFSTYSFDFFCQLDFLSPFSFFWQNSLINLSQLVLVVETFVKFQACICHFLEWTPNLGCQLQKLVS